MKSNFTTMFLRGFFAVIIVSTISINVLGQCEKTIYQKNSFNAVSIEYREKIIKRFELFLRNKCKENFEDLYEMLTPSFRQLNKKEDFVKDMKFYYSEDDKFVSFKLSVINEAISPIDNKPDIWFIEACLTEIVNKKKRSLKTVLEVTRGGEELFFTDITTRPNPLGDNQKCKP